MLEQKLNEYAERFDENFPVFYFRHVPKEEVIKIIDDCLASDMPYKNDADKGEDDV